MTRWQLLLLVLLAASLLLATSKPAEDWLSGMGGPVLLPPDLWRLSDR
ncbi:MAG: hypothetical protein K8U57_37020 [Planctomycetes bacterium]|nr:hypothetical protein [Planctomycetota bacterium]